MSSQVHQRNPVTKKPHNASRGAVTVAPHQWPVTISAVARVIVTSESVHRFGVGSFNKVVDVLLSRFASQLLGDNLCGNSFLSLQSQCQ